MATRNSTRSRNGLTARQCTTLTTGKYNDGGGLWLAVSKTGTRKWFLRVTINGKRREMGLGSLNDVSLAQARVKAAEARAQAAKGVDPIKAKHQADEGVPTFTQAAARYIRMNRHGWSNKKHQRQWTATLKTYARPVIGSKPVDQISTEDVLTILSPIWTTRTETAKRVQGRVENVLDFAAARQWRDPINPARWRGHLDKLLPRPTKVKTIRRQPAMPYTELPAFMAELRGMGSVSSLALQLLILTATRTSETLKAEWSELNMEAAEWTIPASRMKARREHRVPLSKAAVAALEAAPRIADNPYIFPGGREGRPLSQMALLMLMRGMGHGVGGDKSDAVPHGFRSSFRDWSGEVSSFPHDVCEMALAHAIPNAAERAYRRGDLLEKRRKMMEAWSEWCIPASGEKVVPIRREAKL